MNSSGPQKSGASRHAVIVGGGLGGLAAGLRLRRNGWAVTLCEAGPTFGGKMNRFSKQGFTFDTGPSLITMPWVFAGLFRAADSSLEDHIQLEPLHPLAEYVYADGMRFTYSASLSEWLPTLERIAPGDKNGFLRFLELGARLWSVSQQTFMRHTPYERPGAGDWKVLRDLPLRYGWGNYDRTVEAHFQSPYLRQLFNRYPTYVGSSPYLSPATLAVIPYLEFAFGGWYVRGGLYRIVESLVELACRNGIEMRTNARVTEIEKSGGRTRAVILESGERIASDIVIMNGDSAALPALLRGPVEKERSRSMSGFVMLFGIDCDLPQLSQHTIYFSSDYEREFRQICEEQRFPDEPTVYVNAPSRADRTLVPGRGETLFVMANAPARSDQWSEAETATARERVLTKLRRSGFPEIEQHVIVEDTWTPQRIEERYLMPGGAIYGSDSHGWRNAFLRPRNKSRECEGLYRVGGSTHPGGGTPTVLISAEITCALIAKHEH